MKMVTVSQAKSRLSEYIKFAENGEEVVIMRGSKPAVLLTPVTEANLSIAPELSELTLGDFEEEVTRDREAGRLRKLGSNVNEAVESLRNFPAKIK